MTPEIDHIERAIRHIQTAADVDPWAVEIAVEAMRKQIPKKPKHIDKNKKFDGNWKKVCPLCGRMLIERITTSESSYPRHHDTIITLDIVGAVRRLPGRNDMTNEEAIRTLRNAAWFISGSFSSIVDNAVGKKDSAVGEKIEKAVDMAIKALEAQEWIPVDKKSHPDTPERVQVQLNNGWIITAYYQENEWLSVPDCGEPIEDRWIEAWRPLPEPYIEGDTNVNDKS